MRVLATLTIAAILFSMIDASDAQAKKKRKRRPNPALKPIEDEPGLPRVLLIGDSISIGYTLPTREILKGKVNLHRIPANGGDTRRGLDQLDKWLGDKKWDVIHFNWGLHDLRYINDKQQIPIHPYEKNLTELVERLKKTDAKLIWCATTPVPEGDLKPKRLDSDVVAYNEVAKKIMDANGIAINDLYTFALPKRKEIQRPVNVHFTPEGSKVLAKQVADCILKALGKAPVKKKEDDKSRVPHTWDREIGGSLIEVEDYERKVPDDRNFLKATREFAASRRKAVARFFLKGHYVTYRFAAPADGTYIGWLRYGAKNDQTIGAALDFEGKPDFKKAPLPATGGYTGPSVWSWAKLFETELTAGEHTLAITSCALRPDCIFITNKPGKPPKDVLRKGPRKLDPKTAALVKKPLCPVRPDWLDGALDYRLPDWYDSHRVQLHTRLGPPWIKKDIFFHAAEAFKQMGAAVFARHIKSGSEGAWWPSKIGAILPEAEHRNIAKEILDNAHNLGMRVIVYHRHMEDAYMAEHHPDWVCRDEKGAPYKHRGVILCLNSPYADYFLQRALELVDLGADGFFYDEIHMPKQGCWCKFCKERFKAETGLDHPKEPDPDDPVWQKLIDFNNLTIERTFLTWRKALHERNPNLVMLIGSNTWPSLSDRHTTNRLYRIADSMKTEFSLPARARAMQIFAYDKTMKMPERDAKIALGYTLSRDACDGRPAHIWCHGVLDETSMLYATAGMVTHGCIANLDVVESTIPNMMFKKSFELGDRVSPYFAGTKPLRWAVIHYSEVARDHYLYDRSERWKKVLYPVYGAYLALLRAHLPVGIITDSQLEEGLLDGDRVLFLPAPERLTEPMKKAVADFRAGGGVVIEQRDDWLWHDPDGGQEKAIAAFMAAIGDEARRAPVQVFGGPEKMHAVSFVKKDGKRLTVSLCNDFSWVYTGRKPNKDKIAELTAPPPPCEGVKIVLRNCETPKRVFDAVTGKNLTARKTDPGLEITVPAFEYMAVVVAEME